MVATKRAEWLFAFLLAVVLASSLFPISALAGEQGSSDGTATAAEETVDGSEHPTSQATDENTEGIGAEESDEGIIEAGASVSERDDGDRDGMTEDSSLNILSPPASQSTALTESITPLGVIGGYAVTDSGGTTIQGSPFDSMNAAIQGCMNVDPSGTYTVTLAADDTSLGTTVIIPTSMTVTLTSDGSPRTITQDQSSTTENAFRHFWVGGTLILNNIILSGPGNTVPLSYGGGVLVFDGGELRMEENSQITNCYNFWGGGLQGLRGIATLDANSSITSCEASTAGGGIYFEDSVLSLNGGLIEQNMSETGGGIYLGEDSSFTMGSGDISGNEASYFGGGIYCTSSSFIIDTAANSTSILSQNYAGEDGGAIYLEDILQVSIVNAVIDNNTAEDSGGGIYFVQSTDLDNFTMRDTALTNNQALTLYAGGMFLLQGGIYASASVTNYTIENCTVSGNYSRWECGGIFLWHNYYYIGPLAGQTDTQYTLVGNIFEGNRSGADGGGLYFFNGTGQSEVEIYENQFTENFATKGAGIFLDCFDGSGSMNLSSCNLTSNNASEDGGGLYINTDSMSTVRCSIEGGTITGNTAANCGGGVYVNDGTSFTMLTSSATSGNTAIYNNIAELAGGQQAGDDVYATGLDTTVTLLEASLMPIPIDGMFDWYYDDAGMRYRAGDSLGIYTPISQDASNLAVTLGIHHTITYDANGGTGSYSTTVVSGDSHTVLDASAAGISRPGYTFLNWNTRADGSGESYAPGDALTVDANVTLYAQWSEIPATPSSSGITGKPLAGTGDPLGIPTWIGFAAFLALAGCVLSRYRRLRP